MGTLHQFPLAPLLRESVARAKLGTLPSQQRMVGNDLQRIMKQRDEVARVARNKAIAEKLQRDREDRLNAEDKCCVCERPLGIAKLLNWAVMFEEDRSPAFVRIRHPGCK